MKKLIDWDVDENPIKALAKQSWLQNGLSFRTKVKLAVAGLALIFVCLVIIVVSEETLSNPGNRSNWMEEEVDMSLHDMPSEKFLSDYDARTGFSVSEALHLSADTPADGIMGIGNVGEITLNVRLGLKDDYEDIRGYMEILDIRAGAQGKEMLCYLGDRTVFPDDEEVDDYQYAYVQFIFPPDYREDAIAAGDTNEPEITASLVVKSEGGYIAAEGDDRNGFRCTPHFFEYENGKALDGYFAVRLPKTDQTYGLSFTVNGTPFICSLEI